MQGACFVRGQGLWAGSSRTAQADLHSSGSATQDHQLDQQVLRAALLAGVEPSLPSSPDLKAEREETPLVFPDLHLLASLPHSEMLLPAATKPLSSVILSPKWDFEAEAGAASLPQALGLPGTDAAPWPPTQPMQILGQPGAATWMENPALAAMQAQAQLAQQAASTAMAGWVQARLLFRTVPWVQGPVLWGVLGTCWFPGLRSTAVVVVVKLSCMEATEAAVAGACLWGA